jgi:hypothetical protein
MLEQLEQGRNEEIVASSNWHHHETRRREHHDYISHRFRSFRRWGHNSNYANFFLSFHLATFN